MLLNRLSLIGTAHINDRRLVIIEDFNISHGIEIVPSNAPIVTTGYDEEVEEEDVLLCQKCEPNHLAHPLQDTNHHLFAIVSNHQHR